MPEYQGGQRKLYCNIKCTRRFHNRAHYHRNAESLRAKRAIYNARTQARIHSRIKSRAKRMGVPFNLDREDIVVPDVCPVLGIPIFEQHKQNPSHSPSVDRIRPNLGYVKGNVRVISNRANLLKSNATKEEIRLILRDLESRD